MKFRKASAAASVAALIASTTAIVATNASGARAAAAAPAASEGVHLEEIVVTARKREENLQTTPLAVSVVTSKQLEQHNIQTLKDMQGTTPGLVFQQTPYDPFSFTIGIRGQKASDNLQGADPSVGMYLDGVYFATTSIANVNNMLDLERVEVLKGPQGTLYGRNTTGGSINIVTALPNFDEVQGSLMAGYGNYNRTEVAGSINVPLSSKIALRVSGNVTNHDGYAIDTSSNTQLLDEHTRSIHGALRIDPSDKLELVVRGDYTFANGGGLAWHLVGAAAAPAGLQVALYNGLGLNPAAGLAYLLAHTDPDPYKESYQLKPSVKVRAQGASLTATYALTDDISVKSITAFRNYRRNGVTNFVQYGIASTPVEDSRTNMTTEELQLQGNAFDKKLNWIVGYYYYDTSGLDFDKGVFLSQLLPPNYFVIYDNDITATSHSVYGQATYAVTDKLKVTAGVRYTHDQKGMVARNRNAFTCDVPQAGPVGTGPACTYPFALSFSNTSYAASVDYALTDDLFVYGRTASGFKSGGFNQRSNLDSTFLPEKVVDYELGVKAYAWDRRVRANLAGYHSNYTNMQRTVIGPVGATSFIRNAGKAHINGVEAELEATPVQGLTFSGTIAYTDPKYDVYTTFASGVPVDLSNHEFQGQPKWQTSLTATYTVPLSVGELVTSVDWSWQDRVDYQPDNHGTLISPQVTMQPAYSLVSGRLAWNVPEKGWNVAVWCRNMFNKTYYANTIDIESLGVAFAGIGEPRTFGVQIRKDF